MVVQDLIRNISDRLSTTSNVNAVFGEPKTVGNKTIIPVAAIGVGFGAGGGEGKKAKEGEENPSQEGAGGGGGGGGAAKPLAVVEITEDSTKVIPVVDVTRIVVASLMFATAATLMITKLFDRKR
jgi:uncharacterized spore protein YtfJ